MRGAYRGTAGRATAHKSLEQRIQRGGSRSRLNCSTAVARAHWRRACNSRHVSSTFSMRSRAAYERGKPLQVRSSFRRAANLSATRVSEPLSLKMAILCGAAPALKILRNKAETRGYAEPQHALSNRERSCAFVTSHTPISPPRRYRSQCYMRAGEA